MLIRLLLPGLIWPNPTAGSPADGLALPCLERLLGMGQLHRGPRCGRVDALAGMFGLTESAPLAALRRRGEADGDERVTGDVMNWLCADPVHLHFAREHMLLSGPSTLEITSDEASDLIAALNLLLGELASDHLSRGDGTAPRLPERFEAPHPDRWYLRLDQPTDTRFFALDDVIGRPVTHFTPEGGDARQWRRLLNEIEVMLHNHPVNRAREAEGRPTINSLWLWGAADRIPPLAAPARTLYASDPLAIGLARASGMHHLDTDTALDALTNDADTGDSVIVVDNLLHPALQLDLARWRDALAHLETNCFAPLLSRLRTRRLHGLKLIAPGDRACIELTIGPFDILKFWRRPRPLASLFGTSP